MDFIETINDGLKKLEQEKAKDGFVPSVILREDEYRRILAELEKKDLEISALQMEHEHDVKMIDEVKGEAVKLYGEIEELKKDNSHQWEERCKLTFELENKDTIINTMQAEFERLEDLEDNTDMLKMELEKKNRQLEERTNRIKNLEKECQKHFDTMMETIQDNNIKNLI